MSILKVDTINEKTSGNGVAIPGHVIQHIRLDPTGASASSRYSGTSTSYANTGTAVTITPKFSNSLIVVRGSINTGSATGTYLYLTLKRVISGGATTDLGFVTGGVNYGIAQHGFSAAGNLWTNIPIEYSDAPSTTSAVTYQVWARNDSTSNTHYFGWTGGGGGNSHNGIFLTATEIAQ